MPSMPDFERIDLASICLVIVTDYYTMTGPSNLIIGLIGPIGLIPQIATPVLVDIVFPLV
jgi:hypothetical protein